jgi:hypothetical protein
MIALMKISTAFLAYRLRHCQTGSAALFKTIMQLASGFIL